MRTFAALRISAAGSLLLLALSHGARADEPAARAEAPAEKSPLPAEKPPPPAAPEPPVIALPPVPPAPPAVFPSQAEGGRPLVGVYGGHPFLRDARDVVRIYPSAWLRMDFDDAPGAPQLPATAVGSAPNNLAPNNLGPSFFVRRAWFDVAGKLFSRIQFEAGVELGGARIGDTVYGGAGTSRLAMATAHDGRLGIADATIGYAFRRWLNFTAGQQLVPFSLSNRTREVDLELLERPLAIRGFAVPWDRDLGLLLWGQAAPRQTLHYELGVFTGKGYEHPFADANPEFAGRIVTRPLSGLGAGSLFQKAQLGFSARASYRDYRMATYDYPTIATNQGWVLWQPGYVDSMGRVTHVLPSGLQRALGGELRLPFDLPGQGRALDLTAEAYYVENNTREAVDGFVATNSERFGRVQGIGWYAQLAFWTCLGQRFANGEVGAVEPPHVDSATDEPIKRNLEFVLVASGINANYDGAARLGSADPNGPASNIIVYQFGGGAQYWFGTNLRMGIHYMAYYAPGSGTPDNLAVTTGNVADRDGNLSGRQVQHELAIRLAAGF